MVARYFGLSYSEVRKLAPLTSSYCPGPRIELSGLFHLGVPWQSRSDLTGSRLILVQSMQTQTVRIIVGISTSQCPNVLRLPVRQLL